MRTQPRESFSCIYCHKELFISPDQGMNVHLRHCVPYRNLKGIGPPPDTFGDSRAWCKGLTKHSNESLRKAGEKHSERLKRNGNPLTEWNKTGDRTESIRKQSATRKARYANGSLTPAPGVGTGKCSHFTYDGKRVFLRSRYEFVAALYIAFKNLPLNYEDVRVKFENSTRISDFRIGNTLFEIKGVTGSHADVVANAFRNAGYQVYIIGPDKIWKIYRYLSSKGFDMNKYFQLIESGHNSRQYYEYEFTS